MSKLYLVLSLLCSLSLSVLSQDYQSGNCTGELLFEQRGDTGADNTTSFVVVFGAKPDENISCVTATGTEPPNNTVSTVLLGGPGQRYVVLNVTSKNDTATAFHVKVFGHRHQALACTQSTRLKREEGTSTSPPRDKNSVKAAADDMGKIVKQLRLAADRLEAIQKLMLLLANPFGTTEGSS